MAVPRSIDALIDELRTTHEALECTADEAERLGTAPDALVDTMRRLRTPMVKAPIEVGGDELGLTDQMRYFEALSYSNPTAGWIGFNHAGVAGIVGALYQEPCLDEVFGANPAPFLAGVATPSGAFEFVKGGLRATGTYRYASGVRHADWIMVPVIESVDSGSIRLIVIPADETNIGGDWDVMALKGTGSVNVELDGTFVPEHRTVDPLIGPRRGGPMYTLGYQAYVSGENLGFTLGVCQRFFDEVTEYATGKSRGRDGYLADRGAFQYELGKGQLQVNAARAFGQSTLAHAEETYIANNELTVDEEQEVVSMMVYCTESTVGAVTRLFHFAGADSLFTNNVLQRCFRDAHGSAQHHVASNIAYDKFGQQLIQRHTKL
ncbi:MAG: hypothetical protein VX833_03560 [Actinomycetota bacterium]|nr:hypothetical protein [Actinomycetota bacterium]